MATEIQGELEERIASVLWTTLGSTLVKCIVQQVAPLYDVTAGTVLHGTASYPFVSVSSVQTETTRVQQSYNDAVWNVRPVTVAIVADKDQVVTNYAPYRKYRMNAIRVFNVTRITGALTVDSRSCIMQSTVRPKSPVSESAWLRMSKFESAFDVLFDVVESSDIVV